MTITPIECNSAYSPPQPGGADPLNSPSGLAPPPPLNCNPPTLAPPSPSELAPSPGELAPSPADFAIQNPFPRGDKRRRRRIDSLDAPVLAFDTEYVGEGEENRVLGYSYAIGTSDQNYCSGFIDPAPRRKNGRITLEKLVTEAIQHAMEEGVLDKWPEEIIVCAHFLRADITMLSNFFVDIKTKVQGIRKSVASLEDTYGIDIDEVRDKILSKHEMKTRDWNRKPRRVDIAFYDSMLHAPAGKSLKHVGELVGKKKIEIPAPYSIEQMDVFQKEEPELFREYAICDAEISFLHLQRSLAFVRDELRLGSLPFTIGGMATRCFLRQLKADGEDAMAAFGLVDQVKQDWSGSKPRTVRGSAPGPARAILEQFAVDCYHGGRNECFWAGPTEVDEWCDYDVPSCYTVILSDCRPLDYERMRQTHDPRDFGGDVLGLARVRFGFPEGTRFPSLPVKTDRYGLLYPLEGVSYCTAPEIRVALDLGCEVEVLQGFIIPWADSALRIFAPFMQQVRTARLKHPKGSLKERLWKEIGNSIYGKLAQGLRGKTAFDIGHGISSKIKPSKITNPYFASHVTGFARALMSEMLNGVPEGRTVVSVTTDGFLTNAKLEEIDLTGPICTRFGALYRGVDPDGGEVLELKHKARQLIAMKTRGQLTAVADSAYEPVIAKAGVQVPKDASDQHAFMLDLYLNRVPRQKVAQSVLTSTREQMLRNRDQQGYGHGGE